MSALSEPETVTHAILEDLVDPEYRDILHQLPRWDLSDIVAERVRRSNATEAWLSAHALPEGVGATDYAVPGGADGPAQFRHYTMPGGEGPRPLLVWLHGGGHVLGSIEVDEPFVVQLMQAVGCDVVAVRQPLAPEHPYPAPLNDLLLVLDWLRRNGPELGWSGEARTILGGASAGAGLALSAAVKLRDMGTPFAGTLHLVYPMLDHAANASRPITSAHVWNNEANRRAWQAYLGPAPDKSEASLSWIEDLSALPPMDVFVGELDLFHDECRDLVARVRAARGDATLSTYPGAIHGFDRIIPGSQLARRFAADHRTRMLSRWSAPLQ